jgi:transketolase
MDQNFISGLEEKAQQIREDVLEMCIKAGTGHVTSSMSFIDLLVALYHGSVMHFDPANPEWEERDRFILSKGQGSPALYVVLADLGFFPKTDLELFAQKGGKFGVHLQQSVPGVEITCGSLGQGFGMGAGLALGAKMNRELFMTFAILGDGELYEGSIWETAMFAAHHRLNNLIAIIDRNYLCVTDFTENLIKLEPLAEKWTSFGWDVAEIDGHDFAEILNVLSAVRSRPNDRPLAVIAKTTKGHGIGPLCYNPLWHGLAPDGETAELCRNVLSGRCSDVGKS